MPYIYSTLSNPQNYTVWEVSPEVGKPHRAMKTIHIKGGHSIADRKTLVTPIGVVTKVTDAELEALKTVKAFNNHIEKGFIRVEAHDVAPEKVVTTDMNSVDASSQLTEQDFDNPPTVGKPQDGETIVSTLKPRGRRK